MIPFEGTYTRKQWNRGLLLAARPTGIDLLARLVGVGIVLVVLGIVAASFILGEEMSASRILRFALSIGLLAIWIASPYVRAWRIAAQPWRTAGNAPGLAGTVNSEGILTNASSLAGSEKWAFFLRAIVRDDVVVLLSPGGQATILPREFFANDGEWRSFCQLVEFNVKPPR
ncbi:MAG: hypothetical protein WA040_24750 [Anaerolineae bacterium]